MRIGVIGIGHVGLVTAAALADLGHEVVAMDLDAGKVELLQGGKSPFHEPGLDELLTTAIGSGRLSFTWIHTMRCTTPASCSSASADRRPRRAIPA
jgi:UDPglucose 6-dehydrogenase